MASIQASGLIEEIKRVAQGGSVTNRGVDEGRFGVDWYPEISDGETTARARAANVFDCRIVEWERDASSPPVICSTQLYRATIEVRTVRHFDIAGKTSRTLRDKIIANQWQDLDQIVQALEYPGNVNWSGASGSIVSKAMIHTSSRLGRVELGPEPPNFIEAVATFECVLSIVAN